MMREGAPSFAVIGPPLEVPKLSVLRDYLNFQAVI
jgi:hypothetical protein